VAAVKTPPLVAVGSPSLFFLHAAFDTQYTPLMCSRFPRSYRMCMHTMIAFAIQQPDFPIIIINSLSNKWLTIAIIIIIKYFIVEKLYIFALILFCLSLDFSDQ
jgi:hypothetical protein